MKTAPLALAASALAGLCAWAALSPESQLFGRTFVAPADPDEIALTFDDGPNPAATPQLLEVLARHQVRATFFLIGAFALREPALTREIAAAGHTIGNHSMNHPRLPLLSSSAIEAELRGCNRVLEQLVDRPITLFRPPFGARRPAVFRAAAALGLTTVQWNIIVGDWNPRTPADLLARLERKLARNRVRNQGSTIVLHDGGHLALNAPRLSTVSAVAQLLSRLPPSTRFVLPPCHPLLT